MDNLTEMEKIGQMRRDAEIYSLSFRAQGLNSHSYRDPELYTAFPELHTIRSAAECMYKERRKREVVHQVAEE